MCGIAGVCLRQGMANKAMLGKMAAALAHRGPDGEGFFSFLNMGLAHRRLSIIDLEGGKQPLEAKGEKAPVAAVVNGEIYNYKALQRALREEGVPLATGSDSEPLLHLVARDGKAAWQQLQGMYAAAVVDGRSNEMWIGVDPFGIKPLYYVETLKGFAFASEPRALVAAGWVDAQANPNVLGSLLNVHQVRGTETLFAGISRLAPGERFRVKDGKIVERWRQLPVLKPAVKGVSLDEAVAQFEEHLLAAVARHVQADVPFGVLLSGGLDSSAIVVAMAKLGIDIRAFTARFDKPSDEDKAAAGLAAKVGATHTTVNYGAEDFWTGVGELAWTMDDLATDYSSLPLLKLMATAKTDVKILLSGEGGDELLAGYKGYRLPWWRVWLKKGRAGDAVPFAGLFKDATLVAAPDAVDVPWAMDGFTRLQKRQCPDIAEWLPHDLLLRLDRVSMAHGIEGRVPYLDDHFSAWTFALPDAVKVGRSPDGKQDVGKVVVREWLARQGHHDLAWGRKKGFTVPVGDYLGQRKDWVRGLLEGSPLTGSLLRKGAAGKLLGQLGHAKAANLAFSLTLLALWHRVHVEGVGSQQAAA